MHVAADAPPHVFEDRFGLKLLAPGPRWRARPDMKQRAMSRLRASIVARARFIEDLVIEQARLGVGQYVILGAGLDTFAQRRPRVAERLMLFEIDRPDTQSWKRRRLADLGIGVAPWLKFVGVDFEGGESWWERLLQAGFDPGRPTVVASAGVSMYLARGTNAETLRRLGGLAAGSTLAMTFHVPIGLVDPGERPFRRSLEKPGSPFINSYRPAEMLALIREAGFRAARHVSAAELHQLYFAGRPDGLRPSSIEDLVVAIT
jgi:methyltransferase (TIGR00027 family)